MENQCLNCDAPMENYSAGEREICNSCVSAARFSTEYVRVLDGLKRIYSQRHSPWHGCPISWRPVGVLGDAALTEQMGSKVVEVGFSFRNAATKWWDPAGNVIKIFGQRYTLDGVPIGNRRSIEGLQ